MQQPAEGLSSNAMLSRLVLDNDLDMLRYLTLTGEIQMSCTTPCGISAAFLAIDSNRPEVLRCMWGILLVTLVLLNFSRFSDASTIASFLSVLAEMGIDLTQPCDPMGYGSPAFWAAKKGRDECLLELFNIGVDLTAVCEKHGKNTFEIASIT